MLLFSLSGKKEKIPDLIYVRLSELGGIYVKFLQVLVLKDGFLNKSSEHIYHVFDQVPYEQIDIKRILQKINNSHVSLTSTEPIAAGSFAQVYGATYYEKPVVIKVLRPSVEKFIGFDHKMIKIVSLFVRTFSKYQEFPINEIVKQFIKTTKDEINYLQEVNKAQLLHEKFKSHPTIVIPNTYLELCSKNIIVQERLFGIPFTELIVDQTPITENKDFVGLLTELGTQSLLSTLNGEYVHADTHPGNLMLLEGGTKIGLIDFGITAQAPRNRSAFFDLVSCYDQFYKGNFDFDKFFEAIFHFYAPDLYRALRAVDSSSEKNYMYKIKDYAKQKFENRKNDADVIFYLNDARIRELFINVINENNSFGLDIVFDAGEMQVGAGTFNRMLESFSLKPDVMAKVYSNCVDYVQKNGLKNSTNAWSSDTESIARSIENWYSKIAETNPLLFNKLQRLTRS